MDVSSRSAFARRSRGLRCAVDCWCRRPRAAGTHFVRRQRLQGLPTGKQPGSIVPTNRQGSPADRVIDISTVQAGKSIYGAVGTQWVAATGKTSPATG